MELMSADDVLALYSRTNIKSEYSDALEDAFLNGRSPIYTPPPTSIDYSESTQFKPYSSAILKAYVRRFFLSKGTRKKKYKDISEWLSSALKILSQPSDNSPQDPLVYCFSTITGKIFDSGVYEYKPNKKPNPNQIEKGARIQKSIKKRISKKQAQQWLYFNNKRKSYKQ